MEFDSMEAFALMEEAVGLHLKCHDRDCHRQVWRDFWDFPPDLTLRELRRIAKCDVCGSARGNGIYVSIEFLNKHGRDKSISMEEHRQDWRRRHQALILPFPFDHDGNFRAPPRAPPGALMDASHVRLGLPHFSRYALTTGQAALAKLFSAEDMLGNQQPLGGIEPDDEAPIVRQTEAGALEMIRARWGWRRQARGWVTNARDLSSSAWASILAKTQNRCLIPASSFAAHHPTDKDQWGRKRVVWFKQARPNKIVSGRYDEVRRPPMAVAGLWRSWNWKREGLRNPMDAEQAEAGTSLPVFVIVTTEPAGDLGDLRPPSLPLVLESEDWASWLTGNVDQARGLHRKLSTGSLEVAWIGGRHDLEGINQGHTLIGQRR